MAEFETLHAEKVEFNDGGEFIEVSIGVARDGDRENHFARVSRGFYDKEGGPRYRRGGVTLPHDGAVLKRVSDAVAGLAERVGAEAAASEAAGGGDDADA